MATSKSAKKRTGLASHIIALICSFTALIFLLLVLVYNVPIPQDDSPLATDVRYRMWLVTVTDTGGQNLSPFAPLSLNAARQENADTTRTTTVQVKGQSTALRDPTVSLRPMPRPGKLDGHPAWGFGNWGWCEWTRADDFGNAYCKTKAFWRLPRDADIGDSVEDLDLPNTIRVSLSIASFFIIFPAINALFSSILLAAAIASPPAKAREPKKSDGTKEELSWPVWAHYFASDKTNCCVSIVFTCAWCLPVIIVAGMGVDRINSRDSLVAALGMGSGFVIAGFVFLIVADLTIAFGGLYVSPRAKVSEV